MKRAWVDILLIVLLLLATAGVGDVKAQNFERLSDVEAEQMGDLMMVNTDDYQTIKNVRRYWVQESQRLRQMKQLEFLLTGSNEAVMKVVIPARVLFAQNDSTMLSTADNVLRPFVRLVAGKEAVATLVIGGYSDNNGSESYLTMMSGSRARQVHRWFARQGVGPANVHSFGFANRVPRNDNASIAHREKNRRITLYFVPNKKMLKAGKKGTL